MHKYLEMSIDFTNTYIKYKDSSPQIREIMCLRTLYPRGFLDLREGDVFAGRLDIDTTYGGELNFPVVFHPKNRSQVGYNCSIEVLEKLAKEYPEYEEKINWMIDFWKKESTLVKIREEAPQDIKDYLFPNRWIGLDKYGYWRRGKPGKPIGAGFISGSFDTRAGGIIVNFDNLLPCGINGLRKKIDEFEKENGKNDFYDAARISIDLICETMEYYRVQAEKLSLTADEEYRTRHKETAQILADLQHRAPRTLKEAIQLALIFTIVSGVDCFGRFDFILSDWKKAIHLCFFSDC